jgi:hypothetical protein
VCAGQVFSDTSIGCLITDYRFKALGGKLPSLECRRMLYVKACYVVGSVSHGLGVVCVVVLQTRSVLRLRNKRSITALSQQLPFRLMLPTKLSPARSAWCNALAYWPLRAQRQGSIEVRPRRFGYDLHALDHEASKNAGLRKACQETSARRCSDGLNPRMLFYDIHPLAMPRIATSQCWSRQQ